MENLKQRLITILMTQQDCISDPLTTSLWAKLNAFFTTTSRYENVSPSVCLSQNGQQDPPSHQSEVHHSSHALDSRSGKSQLANVVALWLFMASASSTSMSAFATCIPGCLKDRCVVGPKPLLQAIGESWEMMSIVNRMLALKVIREANLRGYQSKWDSSDAVYAWYG